MGRAPISVPAVEVCNAKDLLCHEGQHGPLFQVSKTSWHHSMQKGRTLYERGLAGLRKGCSVQGMVQKLALYLPEAQRHPSGGIAQQVQVRLDTSEALCRSEALLGLQAHAGMQRHLIGFCNGVMLHCM